MSIKIKNVNYTYSEGTAYEMHALKNINLEIPDGQFVGLIGHTVDTTFEWIDKGDQRKDLF